MINLVYAMLKDYGLDAVQLFLIAWFGYKIMTNHLKHIKDDLESIINKTEKIETDLNHTKERIAKIEGKIL